MDLWSKGLGRRVLSLTLGEHESLAEGDGNLVIEGVMHAPTFWEYTVTLTEEDMTEFLGLLQQPDSLRFVADDKDRTKILGAALSGVAVFLARTLCLLALGRSAPSRNGGLRGAGVDANERKIDGRA